jgi:hypothetical protein
MIHMTIHSILNPGWTKNTWMDCKGVRMSQRRILTIDGSLGGQIVWVEMSHGRLVGGRIVKAPFLFASLNPTGIPGRNKRWAEIGLR